MNKSRISCVTYGGKIGWFLRKHFSKYTSEAYLNCQYFIRKRLFQKYIKLFSIKQSQDKAYMPCLISIETVNRCNSTCEFCPANRNAESRPFKKMTEELFYKIISELKEVDYDGYLNLYVNNEPLIDTRIEEWYKYASEQLPNAKMLLYTNGLLMTIERFRKLIPYIDKMIINNYSDNLELHKNIKEIYQFVKDNPQYWEKDITIQIRYIKEILTNRAGVAPNKTKTKVNHKICIMPFTDFTIYPDGQVGLCCSDALEKTNYGNVGEKKIVDIWNGEQYKELRNLIGTDRNEYFFCRGCDFVDAGIRNTFMKNKILEIRKK